MKILVACEESQRVCLAFRKKGHDAFSCDFLPPSGSYPEWHILGDVVPLLNGNCDFCTLDCSEYHISGRWDLLIAFPPCTYLTSAGGRHLYPNGVLNEDRLRKGIAASHFFLRFLYADCDRIAVENPVPCSVFQLPVPSQIIHPYMFGEPFFKRTCLWLKGLPLLVPTDSISPDLCQRTLSSGSWFNRGSSELRQLNRSKTFSCIASAMAAQWG